MDKPAPPGVPAPDTSSLQGAVKPEAVGFRDETQTCRQCDHNGGQSCALFGFPITDASSCLAFSGSSGDDLMAGGSDMDSDLGSDLPPKKGF